MANINDIKRLLSGCVDYGRILKLIIEIRQLELADNSTIIPLQEKSRVDFLFGLTELTEDLIIQEIQKAMLLDATKLVYSGPHINKKDLKEEDLKHVEVKNRSKKDIFENVTFTPTSSDIENELNTNVVKTIDVGLLKQLGIDSE